MKRTKHQFSFGCGHEEPAAWYPELAAIVLPRLEEGISRQSGPRKIFLPQHVLCAWCLAEDEQGLAEQARCLESEDIAATSWDRLGSRRQLPVSGDRRRFTDEADNYRRRMILRGSQSSPNQLPSSQPRRADSDWMLEADAAEWLTQRWLSRVRPVTVRSIRMWVRNGRLRAEQRDGEIHIGTNSLRGLLKPRAREQQWERRRLELQGGLMERNRRRH
jgi:hypothetical protein